MRRVTSASLLLATCLSQVGCAAFNLLAPERDNSDLTFKLKDYKADEYRSIAFCPANEIYMVMPEHGKIGIVEVTFNDGQQLLLKGDYSAMSLQDGNKNAYTADREQMQSLFGNVLSALPDKPIYQTVYFHPGTSKLVAKSKKAITQLVEEIASRNNPEIVIYGHTDTVGGEGFNKKLSTKRAELIRSKLIAKGISAQKIQVSGYGESQLFVKTSDNVSELKNRRVEISVR